MNLQNLFKQFSNLSNLGGLGNFNMQNNQGNNQKQEPQNQNGLYPESFNTNEFYSSNQYNQNFQNRENYNYQNYNNSNSGNYQNQNKNSEGFLNGLLGPNANITSLLPFLSLFKGKSGISSLLKSENVPDSLKNLAPFISMLSTSSEDKSDNPDTIKIDKLKKIDND